jgi:hypothetical protein
MGRWGRTLRELKSIGMDEAVYYLTKDGNLIFKSVPTMVINQSNIKYAWNFKDIASNHMVFFEFLIEAKKLGAKEMDIIRIAGESYLENEIPDILCKLGIQGKKIVVNALKIKGKSLLKR